MTIQCSKRVRKSGTVYRYQVYVRKQFFQASDSLTFKDKNAGKAWAKAVEREMLEQASKAENEEAKYDAAKSVTGDITLGEYLQAYREKQQRLPANKRISQRDLYAVRFWEDSWLAKKRSREITGDHLIQLLDERLAIVQPSTNHLYVSVLRSAIGWQKRVGLHFKRFITQEVMKELWKLELVGKSMEDDTRPTEEQVYLLYREFLQGYNHGLATTPYHHLMLFSIYSTFREGEICRIRYSDLDKKHNCVVIRDRKDPKKKYGNHQKVPLSAECIEIIEMQPRIEGEDRIFPYRPNTIATRFSEKTKSLGFPELRFHSFRHDGISRLFEQKMSIPEVAIRSGHKTWDNLRRYTHLLHVEPPALWVKCKEIETEFWANTEVKNRRLKEVAKHRS